MEFRHWLIKRTRTYLRALGAGDLNQTDAQMTGQVDFIDRKWGLSSVGKVDSIRVGTVAQRLSASVGEWTSTPLHFDCNRFNFAGQLSAASRIPITSILARRMPLLIAVLKHRKCFLSQVSILG